MHVLIACLCLAVTPATAWEFRPTPVCTLLHDTADASLRVTYDPRVPEYAITIRLAATWSVGPVFAIRFDGPRGLTISTTRHRLHDGGRALTVTDSGFGNVLDGLEFNDRATAATGETAVPFGLDGAAPAVAAFRACAGGATV